VDGETRNLLRGQKKYFSETKMRENGNVYKKRAKVSKMGRRNEKELRIEFLRATGANIEGGAAESVRIMVYSIR